MLKMNHKDRCNLGRVAKLCEENYVGFEFDENGKLKKINGFTTPKNIKEKGLLNKRGGLNG